MGNVHGFEYKGVHPFCVRHIDLDDVLRGDASLSTWSCISMGSDDTRRKEKPGLLSKCEDWVSDTEF